MENTHQEKAGNENVSGIPPLEQSREQADSGFNSIAEIWAKAVNSYWDAFLVKKTDKDESKNPFLPKFLTNGAATRGINFWNTYISMCKSLSQAVIDPKTLNSVLKTSDDLPETLLKMQRTEMDRFFNWHSEMLGKTANFEKLTQLMCIKTFM
ncbi:Uncharacterized protein dnl_24960 [Desulfonema limicola]|uniref:Uncharacterized protein n=1 Tax=Desulfonema limicola TaxID=45656 RepID=A0A975GGF0_9BACT|nr:hypothetical protein [Desulfonema limicola]QTA80202.1 Uncharacterized protein dnl_24960 [Desulfonema limicola]